MDLGLARRRAAVAAASSGLGYATAAALMAEGATVTICDVDRGRVQAAAGRLGAGATPVVADLSDPDGSERFVLDAQQAMGASTSW